MTLEEFKGWFEGFTEAIADKPNKKQWARIRAKVKLIDGAIITRHHYHRDYYNPYQNWFNSVSIGSSVGSFSATSNADIVPPITGAAVAIEDMYAAGKSECMSLTKTLRG